MMVTMAMMREKSRLGRVGERKMTNGQVHLKEDLRSKGSRWLKIALIQIITGIFCLWPHTHSAFYLPF